MKKTVAQDADVEDPEGNRIIDVAILREIISSHLVCCHCHHTVRLFEIERKGLPCKFAFHCSNENCDRQLSPHHLRFL